MSTFGLSNLTGALVAGGGVTALIAAVARYLPASRGDIQVRADKLTNDAITRLELENVRLSTQIVTLRDRYEIRLAALDSQHDADDEQRNADRNRIYELERHVDGLTRDLAVQREATAAAEMIAQRMRRLPTDRTRRGDR